MTTRAEREERERIVWNEAIEAAAKDAELWFPGDSARRFPTSGVVESIRQLKRGEYRKDGRTMMEDSRPSWFRCLEVSPGKPFTKGTAYEVGHYEGNTPWIVTDTNRALSLPQEGCRFVPYDPWASSRKEPPMTNTDLIERLKARATTERFHEIASDMREAAAALTKANVKLEKARDALVASTDRLEAILSAMDKYNAETGSSLGGAPFFQAGKQVAVNHATLAELEDGR